MNDLYREILVKPIPTGTDGLKKAGVIALTVLLAAAGFLIHPLALLLAVGAGVLAWFVITGLDLEYEYLYVNGDIDIDKIMNKQRRKRVASYALEELELIAPTGSHDLDPYLGKSPVKDYTSRKEGQASYTCIYSGADGRQIVLLELDEDLLADIRRKAPRKVGRA